MSSSVPCSGRLGECPLPCSPPWGVILPPPHTTLPRALLFPSPRSLSMRVPLSMEARSLLLHCSCAALPFSTSGTDARWWCGDVEKAPAILGVGSRGLVEGGVLERGSPSVRRGYPRLVASTL